MSSRVNGLHLRQVLGRDRWGVPEVFGEDGWLLRSISHEHGSVIVSVFDDDDVEWAHASIAWEHRLPTYEELKLLHKAVWKDRGFAYQCFVPQSSHYNFHEHALHLWGKLDGTPAMPDFGRFGTV